MKETQRPEDNWRRGLLGLPPGLLNARAYRKAGEVYRKRDALADVASGAAVGAGVAYVGRGWLPLRRGLAGGALVAGAAASGALTSRALAKGRLQDRRLATERLNAKMREVVELDQRRFDDGRYREGRRFPWGAAGMAGGAGLVGAGFYAHNRYANRQPAGFLRDVVESRTVDRLPLEDLTPRADGFTPRKLPPGLRPNPARKPGFPVPGRAPAWARGAGRSALKAGVKATGWAQRTLPGGQALIPWKQQLAKMAHQLR